MTSTDTDQPADRFGGWLAATLGLGGLVYAILFALVVRGTSDSVVRTWLVVGILGGLVASGVFVALYERLRAAAPMLALWAAFIGVAGALGQTLNASVTLGYDVSGTSGGTPDPLGMLRFGLNGIALILFGWAMTRERTLPRNLAMLAAFGGVLLVVMYVGRVAGFITPATKPTLIPPFLYGVVVHPVFYLWLSRILGRSPGAGLADRPSGGGWRAVLGFRTTTGVQR